MEFLPNYILVLYGLAFLAGLPLNGYWTASAIWFLNRAMCDFIFIFCLTLRFILIFSRHVDWAWRLSSSITSMHMFSSAFLLMDISVHRCILVARPEWAQKCCTASLARWVSLGTLVLSVGFSWRYSDLWESLFSPPSTRMSFQMDLERAKAAIAIQFLTGFLIPLALSVIPTFCVVHTARRGRNRLIQATQPLKILLGLIPTFILCWLPYHVFFFMQLSAMPSRPFLEIGCAFTYVLTYVNSCLNPIFYLTMEEEFLRYRQRARNPHTTDHLERNQTTSPIPPALPTRSCTQ
nr:chemokine-like receptor 1 [Pelodiscus sinensis]|eukprot:XP_006113766.1 chemokine-like receptor 1 [Pelodiscus sinensis]